MRGFVGFLAHRLFRALVALWLVSTVVFVVMRLSRRPGAAAPAARRADAARSCGCGAISASTGRCPCSTASFSATSSAATSAAPSTSGEPALRRGAGLPAAPRSSWASPPSCLAALVARARRAPLRREAQLAPRPRRDGRGPRRPVGADVLPRHPVHPAPLAQGRPLPDLRARRLAAPRAARAHARRLHHGLDRAAHALGRARGAARRLHPHRAGQGPGRAAGWWPSTRSRTPRCRSSRSPGSSSARCSAARS